MKKVLCFGDSNTFGFIPEKCARYDKDTRWSGLLKTLCNGKFLIAEAGCNNRTAFEDNPAGKEQTGYKILPEYLKTENFDIVILAIGINDLQRFFNPNLNEFKEGLTKLIEITRSLLPQSEIILVCPSKLDLKGIKRGIFSFQFNEESVEKSFQLPQIYKNIAKKYNCEFVDLNEIVEVSPLDGLHFSAESHKKIAKYLYEVLLNFLQR